MVVVQLREKVGGYSIRGDNSWKVTCESRTGPTEYTDTCIHKLLSS